MIKIDDFVKQYEEYLSDNLSKDNACKFIQKHILKDKYINYEEKCDICNRIVNASYHTSTEIAGETKRIFVANSTSAHMLYRLELIKNYTDIEIVYENGMALYCYNALDRLNLIDTIIENLPQTEVDKMQEILDMKIDDLYENERSFIGMIDTKTTAIGSVFGELFKSLEVLLHGEEFVNKLSNKLDKLIK